MDSETSAVYYDNELNIEAYYFKGIKQRFPNHFHEYYVFGFIESGQRYLRCKNREYVIESGNLLLFNPRDNHTCQQIDGKTLDYRCINIQTNIMKKIMLEITGKEFEPCFNQQVILRSELVCSLRDLHSMIMQEKKDFKKEEILLFLMEQLVEEYTDPLLAPIVVEPSSEIKMVCEFLEKNYKNSISLADLCGLTGLSKYYLLRSFTKQKGISPYSYLENIRIGKARQLLEEGITPLNVALETGFSDQSHFTNFFKKFIGLTPKQYMKIFLKKDDNRGGRI